MNIETTIGLVSAAISIPAIFIPEKWRSKRLVFLTFILISAIFSGIIVYQSSKLSRVRKVSRGAMELVNDRDTQFTHKGFVLASLAFLEQNKDLYPESYERAKAINEELKKSNYSSDEVGAAFDISGLLKGIGTLNKIEEND